MQTKFWIAIAATVAIVSAAVAGAVYYKPYTGGSGQLAVAVHDAPCPTCSHVWVTFASVAVHESNTTASGWTTLNVTGTTIDLQALNGTALAKVIGVATLPVGQYEQVRLTVTNVTVELANGTQVVASIPASTSADAHGAFNITAGATTTISIDVDLASSLHVVTTGLGVTAIFTPNIGAIVVV